MRMRNPWRRLSGGMAAAFCSALLAAIGAAPAPASATLNAAVRVLPDGTWGVAKELPGLAALNKGGDGVISSVSCASPGNCDAGGIYRDGAGRTQAFVASQTNGTWGKAIQVPGTGALNVGGDAEIIALSCASPGNCSAGGEYSDHRDFFQAFVVTQTNGTWGKAIQIPGSAALNLGDNAEVTALSCASAGNCSAAGHYGDSHGRHVFVVNQTNGTWGNAIQIPGTHLSRVEFAEVASVSCPAVGDCGAGGFFTDRADMAQPFVASERNGTWGKAIEVPGIKALNVGGNGGITGLSCGAVGDCSAGGTYQDGSGHAQAFVVSERNGSWGKAIEVPGTASLNRGKRAAVDSLSCASPGNCSASGVYTQGRSLDLQPFVVSERNGTWGKAIEVPGIEALNKDGETHVFSMSCGAAGDCDVGGSILDHAGDGQAFVVSQAHGSWGRAIEVPGTVALNAGGNAGIESLSCSSPGRCSAGGFYVDGRGRLQAFVVSET